MENELSQDCIEKIQYWILEIEKNPSDADNYNEIGNVYADCGVHDKAIVAYKKAISIDDENPYFYYNMALAFKEIQKYDEAIALFQDLVDHCPKEMKDFIDSVKNEIRLIKENYP